MKIHLGCGSNYLPGWINVDLDSPLADLHADLRGALPYDNASVDYIYNEHFLEHITHEEGINFLQECRRVLKPGGILRISTPNLCWLVENFSKGKLDEWIDVGWEPKTSCRLLNEGMRLWGHQFVYDFAEISQSLDIAGFSDVIQVRYRESAHPELVSLECRPWHQELIIEAR